MTRNPSFWLSSLALLVGCSDYGINNSGDPNGGPAPDIVVEPDALVFDELRTGEKDKQTFVVRNVGSVTLNVSDIIVASGLSFEVDGDTEFDLEPEEEQEVEVEFSPMGADENFGQVLVLSDDPDTPEAPVDLLGYGSVPELEITPASYQFVDAVVPCGDEVELTLKNVGKETLTITEMDYSSAGLLSLDSNVQLPVDLQPGDERKVTVVFSPTTAGGDSGRLDVTSNDPRGVVSADQSGEGLFEDENTEVFTQPGVPPVDVMMLIDHSCSMEGDNTPDVEQGMPDFVNTLQQVADWQLIQVTKEDGCANGGIIDPSTPNPDQLLINNAWNGNAFEPMYLTEKLLQLAALALSLTDAGECNEGFLRAGSLLHIIVITDEPEQSGQSHLFWLGEYGNYVTEEYLKVSAVVDVNHTCGEGSAGYVDAANATGGSILNICNGNWGANFSDIASEVLEGISTYNLSEPAADGTVVVTVNGVPTTDFDFSEDTNSVTINDPPVEDGDVVEISYSVLAECD